MLTGSQCKEVKAGEIWSYCRLTVRTQQQYLVQDGAVQLISVADHWISHCYGSNGCRAWIMVFASCNERRDQILGKAQELTDGRLCYATQMYIPELPVVVQGHKELLSFFFWPLRLVHKKYSVEKQIMRACETSPIFLCRVKNEQTNPEIFCWQD